jgi:hypothetical protein
MGKEGKVFQHFWLHFIKYLYLIIMALFNIIRIMNNHLD